MRLEGKVVVITGGNSGIGLATAREFIANGSRVAIFGRNPTTLRQAADALGDSAMAIQGDVRKLADLDRLYLETSKRFGPIDVLVANAGIAKFAPLESLSEELFDELSGILFKGVFFTVQRALPYLRDGASGCGEVSHERRKLHAHDRGHARSRIQRPRDRCRRCFLQQLSPQACGLMNSAIRSGLSNPSMVAVTFPRTSQPASGGQFSSTAK